MNYKNGLLCNNKHWSNKLGKEARLCWRVMSTFGFFVEKIELERPQHLKWRISFEMKSLKEVRDDLFVTIPSRMSMHQTLYDLEHFFASKDLCLLRFLDDELEETEVQLGNCL